MTAAAIGDRLNSVVSAARSAVWVLGCLRGIGQPVSGRVLYGAVAHLNHVIRPFPLVCVGL